jgi:hypothetical protein
VTTWPIDESVAYYTAHGPITDPGSHASSLDRLPVDLRELSRAVRGLIIHYQSDTHVACDVPAERFDVVRTRRLVSMLTRLADLDPRPFTIARPPERRLIGCCRHIATLMCAILRHHGVPARVRVGFAS